LGGGDWTDDQTSLGYAMQLAVAVKKMPPLGPSLKTCFA
jgi:hypothetical protein